MKYRDLQIQTQREFPSNMRTQGFGWLVRAGYITRENEILPLGKQAIEHLKCIGRPTNFHFAFCLCPLSQINKKLSFKSQ